MKKRFLPLLLMTVVVCLLTGCHMEVFQNEAYHFKLSFPDYMTVFEQNSTIDETILNEYNMSKEDLTSDWENGCIYFAMGTKDGVQRKVSVSVQESDYSAEIWQLKEEDTETVATFTDDIIEYFNSSGEQLNAIDNTGYHVLNKGEFRQGDSYCVFVDIAPYGSDQYDSIYMATIHNGKWYSVLYNTNVPITEETEEEAHDIFDTFFITETLNQDGTTTNTSGVKALLVVLIVAIVVAVIVLIVRLFGTQKGKEEEGPYVAQFKDPLDLEGTKKQKDKKQ